MLRRMNYTVPTQNFYFIGAQSKFSQIATAWRALSSTIKMQWIACATTYTFYDFHGNPYTPSGYQVFLSCSLNLRQVGLTNNPTATNFHTVPAAILMQEGIDMTGGMWIWDSCAGASSTRRTVFNISPVQNSFGNPGKCKYKFFDSFVYTQSFPVNKLSLLQEFLGRDPIPGERFYLETRYVELSSGISSTLSYTMCTVWDY